MAPSESDTNLSSRRERWLRDQVDEQGRALLADDARLFLHPSVSTPCLAAVERAEGIFIEDSRGRRYMDFHGNNVHQVGYGHPRLRAAIETQMATLPFAPRRFACAPAVELAAKLADITPGDAGKVLFATGGSDAVEIALKLARVATGRFKTTMGNVLTLTPPLTVTEAQMDRALDIIEEGLATVSAAGPQS